LYDNAHSFLLGFKPPYFPQCVLQGKITVFLSITFHRKKAQEFPEWGISPNNDFPFVRFFV
jgi:hypothetical protein